MNSLIEKLLTGIQTILPQRAMTALVYRLTRSETPWLKNFLITVISSVAGVDWSEAESTDLDDYPSFNAFFTRELVPGARPVDASADALVSPSDGRVSEFGPLDGDRILQAKGQTYSLATLLANDPVSTALDNGEFCTIYLSPRDYHRVRMPLAGRLRSMTYVPGKLYSVAPYTVRQVPGLFALNERVVSIFDTELGPFALVLVGAMLVDSMETVWAGTITPNADQVLSRTEYRPGEIELAKGAEMGRFNMGSTVIFIGPKGTLLWSENLSAGQAVQMGQRLGGLACGGTEPRQP